MISFLYERERFKRQKFDNELFRNLIFLPNVFAFSRRDFNRVFASIKSLELLAPRNVTNRVIFKCFACIRSYTQKSIVNLLLSSYRSSRIKRQYLSSSNLRYKSTANFQLSVQIIYIKNFIRDLNTFGSLSDD